MEFNTTLFIIGCVIGLIVALIATSVMKASMRPVSRAHTAQNYVVDGSFRIRHRNDYFLRREVSRTPKQKPQQPAEKK